jgi:hypothetical protein
MTENSATGWGFLTNHARVLLCIAHDSGIRLRDIGDHVGITERATHRIVTELTAAGCITRVRAGRRNQYTINPHFPLPDPIACQQNIGQLYETLTRTPAARPAGQSPRHEQIMKAVSGSNGQNDVRKPPPPPS